MGSSIKDEAIVNEAGVEAGMGSEERDEAELAKMGYKQELK